jgi:small subunit ribosomal protein S17e
MKRIQKRAVRGISIKLQEENRESSDNYIPEVCYIDQQPTLEVNVQTNEILKELNFNNTPNLQLFPSGTA